jgi:hypothetical protein
MKYRPPGIVWAATIEQWTMANNSIISTIRCLFAGRNAAPIEHHITSPTETPIPWTTKYPVQIRVPAEQDRFLYETRYHLQDRGVHYARITQRRNPDALYLFKSENAASILRHHLREINVQERPVGDWWSGVDAGRATG